MGKDVVCLQVSGATGKHQKTESNSRTSVDKDEVCGCWASKTQHLLQRPKFKIRLKETPVAALNCGSSTPDHDVITARKSRNAYPSSVSERKDLKWGLKLLLVILSIISSSGLSAESCHSIACSLDRQFAHKPKEFYLKIIQPMCGPCYPSTSSPPVPTQILPESSRPSLLRFFFVALLRLPAEILLNLLNFPVLFEVLEPWVVPLFEPIFDPRPWRKDPNEARTVPKAAILRMGRRVGRQQAMSATFVSTTVQTSSIEHTAGCVLLDANDHANDRGCNSKTSEQEYTAQLYLARVWHLQSPDLTGQLVNVPVLKRGWMLHTQGNGSIRMHKSKTASVIVKTMVASKPKGQFSAMLASDPQLAEKFRRQSKMKPKKNASIHITVRITKTNEVAWNPRNTKIRR
ncbi:hypothetical protein J1614_001344 [Plenodomus biglobosus]|nr:hypothetical protein J1614_001344 [Plenodomus biglobosus]